MNNGELRLIHLLQEHQEAVNREELLNADVPEAELDNKSSKATTLFQTMRTLKLRQLLSSPGYIGAKPDQKNFRIDKGIDSGESGMVLAQTEALNKLKYGDSVKNFFKDESTLQLSR